MVGRPSAARSVGQSFSHDFVIKAGKLHCMIFILSLILNCEREDILGHSYNLAYGLKMFLLHSCQLKVLCHQFLYSYM